MLLSLDPPGQALSKSWFGPTQLEVFNASKLLCSARLGYDYRLYVLKVSPMKCEITVPSYPSRAKNFLKALELCSK